LYVVRGEDKRGTHGGGERTKALKKKVKNS